MKPIEAWAQKLKELREKENTMKPESKLEQYAQEYVNTTTENRTKVYNEARDYIRRQYPGDMIKIHQQEGILIDHIRHYNELKLEKSKYEAN